METKIEFYLNKMIGYDPYSVLEVLFHFEEKENYEECAIIYKSIKRFNRIYKETYPTTRTGYMNDQVRKMITGDRLRVIRQFKEYIIDELKRFKD